MRGLSTLILLASAIICGCAVGPDYKPPVTHSAESFGEMNSLVTTNEPVADWWKEFHDPEMEKLIHDALQDNLDLQMATMRIRESRFQRNIAAADLFPEVDADGSFTHTRGSKNVVLPLGGSGSGNSGATGSGGGSSSQTTHAATQSRAATPSAGSGGDFGANPLGSPPSPFGKGGLPGATTDLYQVGFDASWEIDVFGGKRRQVEAATAEFRAAEEARHDLQVSLAAEVARDYIELRGAQDELEIAKKNLADQKTVLELTQSKRKVGLTSELDTTRAAAQVAATAATIEPLQGDVRRLSHALAILVGKEPNELTAELTQSQPLPATPPMVPIGLPSQLLKRRADIKQAERLIAAANARIGSARADLFPKFALVGSAGLDSSSADNLFNWESRYFLISPTVSWRIFDAGRVIANINLQRANEREASLQYRSTVLKALREVEDALVAYATEQTRRGHLQEEFDQNQKALQLARNDYDQGLTDFLSVLDAERNVLSTQDNLSRSSQSVSTDLVALYKSLGGGWK